MSETSIEYRLCYISRYERRNAYFTRKPLAEQWGDDWNDAPYEHNAGTPYCDEPGQIISIIFDADLVTPDEGHCNSPYSVEEINSGAIAWLRTPNYSSGERVNIFAGTLLSDFMALIHKAGGQIYLPHAIDTEAARAIATRRLIEKQY